jgi:hypothetical protein
MCCGQKNMSVPICQRHWDSSKTSDSAWLECVVVKNFRFSLAGMCGGTKVIFCMIRMCCGKKRQIQHGWNVLWSKSQIQQGWNVLWSKTSDPEWLEYVVVNKRQIQHGWNVS